MAKFEITFRDEISCEDEVDAIHALIDYLEECVKNMDVTCFTIVRIE